MKWCHLTLNEAGKLVKSKATLIHEFLLSLGGRDIKPTLIPYEVIDSQPMTKPKGYIFELKVDYLEIEANRCKENKPD